MVPRTHTGFGDRTFQVAGPRLLNNMPASLRQSDTTGGQFKKLLKTHLFSTDCGALVTVAFTAPCTNIFFFFFFLIYYLLPLQPLPLPLLRQYVSLKRIGDAGPVD